MMPLRFPRWLAATAVVLLLGGCTTTRHIREAQDAFNTAARSENDLRAAAFAGSEPVEVTAAAADYRKAVALLNQELADNHDELTADQLLGNALMIKALSLWRLTDLDELPADEAELSATLVKLEALASDRNAVGTRDRVLIRAIPGLRDHDRGLRATTLQGASGYFTSAYKVLERSLTDEPPPPNHPVRIYVRLAQLATLRAYQAAVFQFQPVHSAERAGTLTAIYACATYSAAQIKPVAGSDPDLAATLDRLNTALGLPSVRTLPDQPPACSFII